MTFDLARVARNFQTRIRTNISASISDFTQLTPRVARVIAVFSTVDADQGDLHAAITAALDGQAVPIDDSFRPIDGVDNALAGFVRTNTQILSVEDAKSRGFRATAANVLVDPEDDSIWEIKSTGGEQMLVRQGHDNLRGLLETASVSIQRVPKLDTIRIQASVDNNTRGFAAFIDPKTTEVRYGYVVQAAADAVEILPFPTEDQMNDPTIPRATNVGEQMVGDGNAVARRLAQQQAPINVGLDYLVEIAYTNGGDNFATAAVPASGSRQAMIDYYRKVYGDNKAYFDKLVEIIQSHSNL